MPTGGLAYRRVNCQCTDEPITLILKIEQQAGGALGPFVSEPSKSGKKRGIPVFRKASFFLCYTMRADAARCPNVWRIGNSPHTGAQSVADATNSSKPGFFGCAAFASE